MSKTKDKILLHSISLFNQEGMVNVRLQHIADACEISIGNLTYHYKNKAEILSAVYEKMMQDLHKLAFESKAFDQGTEGKEIMIGFLSFQWQYRFFYLDTLEIMRAYPDIKVSHQKQVKHEIGIIKKLIYVAVGEGLMIPEPTVNLYDGLANHISMGMSLRLTNCEIKGENGADLGNGLKDFIQVLFPYLTEEGRMEYFATMKMLNEQQLIFNNIN